MTLSERLRGLARYAHCDCSVGDEAADEIDRLTAENAALREERDALAATVDMLVGALNIYGKHSVPEQDCDTCYVLSKAKDPAAILAARDAQTRKSERERCAKACEEIDVSILPSYYAAAIRALED